MPFWDSIKPADDQQCLDFIAANEASATAMDEATFRNQGWAEVRDINGYLVGLVNDPDWPGTTKAAGCWNPQNSLGFIAPAA